jgi:hypothetical protein
MQCACTILSSAACLALQYFSTLANKRHDFRKKVSKYKKWVLISSTNFVWNVTHIRRKEQDMIKKVYWPSCKVILLLSDFNETWIFSKEFRKILKYQIPWESDRKKILRISEISSRLICEKSQLDFQQLTTVLSRLQRIPDRHSEASQHPIQWVPGAFPRGSNDRGVKLTTHLNLVPRLK